jgi:hypothetical protein
MATEARQDEKCHEFDMKLIQTNDIQQLKIKTQI